MQLRGPNPHNPKTAGTHVSVLRCVQSHSFALPDVGLWELQRVSVPVIPVNLDDYGFSNQQSINNKLSLEQVLGFKCKTPIGQNPITQLFWSGWLHCLLKDPHPKKLCFPVRVQGPAADRTVSGILFLSGGRPSERLFTNLTGICVLVTSLPLGRTGMGTKTTIPDVVWRPAERLFAPSTFLGGWLWETGSVTRQRTVAVALVLSQRPKHGLTCFTRSGLCSSDTALSRTNKRTELCLFLFRPERLVTKGTVSCHMLPSRHGGSPTTPRTEFLTRIFSTNCFATERTGLNKHVAP